MRHKFLYYVSILVIGFCIGCILVVAYWLLYPYEVISFKQGILPILNPGKKVKPGSNLLIDLDLCRHMDIDGLTTRYFVNSILYTVPPERTQLQKGCVHAVFPYKIPEDLPAGIYSLMSVANFQVNPIRTVRKSISTEQFEVIE